MIFSKVNSIFKSKTVFFFLVCIITQFSVFSQKEFKITGNFDNDKLLDTLFYKDCRFIEEYVNKDISYECKMTKGNGSISTFNIPLGYDSIQIQEGNKRGYIEIYQWKVGKNGFEIYETYVYNKKYNTWILHKSETLYQDGKKEIYKPKELIGIDGELCNMKTKSDLRK